MPTQNDIRDVRDGLTRKERAVLYCLQEAQREFGDRHIPTLLLFGRVCEKIDIGQEEFQCILARLMSPPSSH